MTSKSSLNAVHNAGGIICELSHQRFFGNVSVILPQNFDPQTQQSSPPLGLPFLAPYSTVRMETEITLLRMPPPVPQSEQMSMETPPPDTHHSAPGILPAVILSTPSVSLDVGVHSVASFSASVPDYSQCMY
ncbi:uncharacterized protein LOC124788226 [Schistocerca piceifrons]|uniref:uncharacterized protein LOC124788226 n=1 Tax=Schistocerca piceifrons TaxID=274613 RepID=UPI001F5E94D7|nr:uncharacterized protein LOC124788226 [Schistocerca piceifrons]